MRASELLKKINEKGITKPDNNASGINIKVGMPSEFDRNELKRMKKLLVSGQEVVRRGLLLQIERAPRIGLVYDGNSLIAAGAIKKPRESYHTKVFTKAGIPELQKEYSLEIGWLFTKPEYRKQGIMNRLLSQLLHGYKAVGLFATTAEKNMTPQRILTRHGFKTIGKPYVGELSGRNIFLWGRA